MSDCNSGSRREAIEAMLRQIWSDLLGVQDISGNDHFFSLGGDSMAAMRMLEPIEAELRVRLALPVVMEHLILRDLASCIDRLLATEALVPRDGGVID